MTITGNDFIDAFKAVCESENKFFIPDSPRQDDIADSLVKHYDSDDLLDAIKWCIKSEQGPFLIFDFALKSRDYIEKVKRERNSVVRFKQVVADTRKLLEDEL